MNSNKTSLEKTAFICNSFLFVTFIMIFWNLLKYFTSGIAFSDGLWDYSVITTTIAVIAAILLSLFGSVQLRRNDDTYPASIFVAAGLALAVNMGAAFTPNEPYMVLLNVFFLLLALINLLVQCFAFGERYQKKHNGSASGALAALAAPVLLAPFFLSFEQQLETLLLIRTGGMNNAIHFLLILVVFPSTMAGIVLCILSMTKISKMEKSLRKGLFISFIGGIVYIPVLLYLVTSIIYYIRLSYVLQIIVAIIAIILNRAANAAFPKETVVKQNSNNKEYSNFTERDYSSQDDSILGENTPKDSSSRNAFNDQAERLLKLKELYDKGAISDLEYEQMKKKIIQDYL